MAFPLVLFLAASPAEPRKSGKTSTSWTHLSAFFGPSCRNRVAFLSDGHPETGTWSITSTRSLFRDDSCWSNYEPVIADQKMLGTFQGDGDASKLTSFGKTLLAALPWVTNQGGVGVLRKGARNTDFCGRENISVL